MIEERPIGRVDTQAPALEDRIERARQALSQAPDLGDGDYSKNKVRLLVNQMRIAWLILAEGIHPPSVTHPAERAAIIRDAA